MLDLNQAELKFAIESVREASLMVRRIQAYLVSATLTKGDRSPVTVADFTSQALIGRRLAEHFPQAILIAEEDSRALLAPEAAETLQQVVKFAGIALPGASPQAVCGWIDTNRADSGQRFWTLDPIDGTKGFLRGDQYAVALALVEDGEAQIGVLGCPNLNLANGSTDAHAGVLIAACRGQGAWQTDLEQPGQFTPLATSTVKDPRQARLLRSYESGHTNVSQIDLFTDALGVQAKPVRMDSQAKYGVLAAGQGEIILRLLSSAQMDYREKIWDQAAGSIILEEAGGRISDLHGRPLDFSTGRQLLNNRGILATNGHLHQHALQALREIGA
jgi:3'(2'), 5'-bisphosphate nucleotidase